MKEQTHRAGFVSIIGNPNAGKSTLLNAFMGERFSIATPKAQTTRHRIFGILNSEEYQIVFSDTPGVIQPAYALQESMLEAVRSVFEDSDLLLYLVEANRETLKDEQLYQQLKAEKNTPLFVILNKIDLLTEEQLTKAFDFWEQEFPQARIFPVAAQEKFQTAALLEEIIRQMPPSPPFFDKEALSDRSERFFAEEMIREQLLVHYQKELPYACEVEVEEFKETPDLLRIRANIYVERPTQKSIIIGSGGKMIKKTGTAARRQMELFFKQKIFLDLHVKVRKNWRNSDRELKRFGYRR